MDFSMPVFMDNQIENITQAVRTIENGVPFIEFMCVEEKGEKEKRETLEKTTTT